MCVYVDQLVKKTAPTILKWFSNGCNLSWPDTLILHGALLLRPYHCNVISRFRYDNSTMFTNNFLSHKDIRYTNGLYLHVYGEMNIRKLRQNKVNNIVNIAATFHSKCKNPNESKITNRKFRRDNPKKISHSFQWESFRVVLVCCIPVTLRHINLSV